MIHIDRFLNQIIEGDCLEVMKDIPDKSVDLVLTDPPYGINYQSNFRQEKFLKIENDDTVNVDWIKISFDKLKDGGALYCCTRWDVFDKWKCEIEKYFDIKNTIIWYKHGGGLGDLTGAYIYNHEFIIFATKGKHYLRGKRINDVWEIQKDNVNNYLHPTQKPILLMETMIDKSTDKGDIILDPFLGSGTTAIAAHNTGRFFIGIEKEPKYVEIARKRLEQAQAQQSLFA